MWSQVFVSVSLHAAISDSSTHSSLQCSSIRRKYSKAKFFSTYLWPRTVTSPHWFYTDLEGESLSEASILRLLGEVGSKKISVPANGRSCLWYTFFCDCHACISRTQHYVVFLGQKLATARFSGLKPWLSGYQDHPRSVSVPPKFCWIYLYEGNFNVSIFKFKSRSARPLGLVWLVIGCN